MGHTEPGSINVVGWWTIAGRADPTWLGAGQDVHKVGQSSGATAGPITGADPNFVIDGTCTDVWIEGSKTLLCQYKAHLLSWAGDSGSPVYMPNNSTESQVWLAGMLWGGNGDIYSIFNPLSEIERDFFTFAVEVP
jgi:hypothetical protein